MPAVPAAPADSQLRSIDLYRSNIDMHSSSPAERRLAHTVAALTGGGSSAPHPAAAGAAPAISSSGAGVATQPAAATEPRRPNICFVLTDDQGYGELGCHGNTVIQTPAIDSLHESAVRFTDFHVGTTCAPTRAGLLTGHFCNSAGVWHTIGGRSLLREDEWTLATALSSAGYRCAHYGKWRESSQTATHARGALLPSLCRRCRAKPVSKPMHSHLTVRLSRCCGHTDLGDAAPFRAFERGFEHSIAHAGGGAKNATFCAIFILKRSF